MAKEHKESSFNSVGHSTDLLQSTLPPNCHDYVELVHKCEFQQQFDFQLIPHQTNKNIQLMKHRKWIFISVNIENFDNDLHHSVVFDND